jgi:hypothetical protein
VRAVVGDAVLVAQRLHPGLEPGEVAVAHRREEVVLDLQVQAAGQQESHGGVHAEVLGGQDLVTVVVPGVSILNFVMMRTGVT